MYVFTFIIFQNCFYYFPSRRHNTSGRTFHFTFIINVKLPYYEIWNKKYFEFIFWLRNYLFMYDILVFRWNELFCFIFLVFFLLNLKFHFHIFININRGSNGNSLKVRVNNLCWMEYECFNGFIDVDTAHWLWNFLNIISVLIALPRLFVFCGTMSRKVVSLIPYFPLKA